MREPTTLTRRAAAALPLAALFGPAAAAVAPPAGVGDAELLDLGRRWHVAWSALHEHDLYVVTIPDDDDATNRAQDAIGDRLYADEQRLFDDILAMPASTLRGLALKAQVVARAFDVMEPGIAPIEAKLAAEQPDLETGAALTLALDILRLARATS